MRVAVCTHTTCKHVCDESSLSDTVARISPAHAGALAPAFGRPWAPLSAMSREATVARGWPKTRRAAMRYQEAPEYVADSRWDDATAL